MGRRWGAFSQILQTTEGIQKYSPWEKLASNPTGFSLIFDSHEGGSPNRFGAGSSRSLWASLQSLFGWDCCNHKIFDLLHLSAKYQVCSFCGILSALWVCFLNFLTTVEETALHQRAEFSTLFCSPLQLMKSLKRLSELPITIDILLVSCFVVPFLALGNLVLFSYEAKN